MKHVREEILITIEEWQKSFDNYNKMKHVREEIVSHYRHCSTDRYGQMSVIDIFTLIDGNNQEELNELNSLMVINTYGGRYGTYKGVSPWGSFKCTELEAECRQAFAQNENRKRNENQW